jgi:hypothetical protein
MTAGNSADESGLSANGVELADVLAGLAQAVARAKQVMDETTRELAHAYSQDPLLRTLLLPYFTLPEVRMQLKFAVAGVVGPDLRTGAKEVAEPPVKIRVIVDAASLEKLPSNLISEVELRISPQMLRSFQTAEERIGIVDERTAMAPPPPDTSSETTAPPRRKRQKR